MRLNTLLFLSTLGTLAACDSTEEIDGTNLVAVLPYTGDFASGKAEFHLNSMTLAIDHLIEGGAHDHLPAEFQIIPVNSGNGKEFVQGAVENILEEQASGEGKSPVLGMMSSTGGAHEGSAAAAINAGIPHFEVSSGAHDEEFLYCSPFTDAATCTDYSDDQKNYMFSSRALCRPEAEVTADFIANEFPGAKVALVRGNKTHDRLHTNIIRATLDGNADFTGEVLESGDANNDQDFIVSYEQENFQADIQTLIDTHAPDVIFWHLRGDAVNVQFATDLATFGGTGWDGSSVTCGMARSARFIDNAQNNGISPYLAGTDREGAFYFVMRSPIPGANLDAFKADYEDRYGTPPDTFSPSAYDAGMLLGLGVLAAGGPDAGHQAIRDAIIESSRGGQAFNYTDSYSDLVSAVASGADINYEGAAGNMDWDASRIVAGSYYVEAVMDNGDGSYSYEELLSPPRVNRR